MDKDFVPYFVEVRGCKNCSHYEQKIEKEKKNWSHEDLPYCLVKGCWGLNFPKKGSWGYNVYSPFIDPEKMINIFNKHKGNPKEIPNVEISREKVKNYCLGVKKTWGIFYKRSGINIDNLLKKL